MARTIVLNKLTAQARTRAELEQVLAKKLVPAEVARTVLDRFEQVGLVDDAAFARGWAESRQRSRGLSRRAIAQELRRKGVPDDLAGPVLDEIDPADEEQAARELVRRRLRSMGSLDGPTRRRRLAGMLARKGYPGDLTFRVVAEELEDAFDVRADAGGADALEAGTLDPGGGDT